MAMNILESKHLIVVKLLILRCDFAVAMMLTRSECGPQRRRGTKPKGRDGAISCRHRGPWRRFLPSLRHGRRAEDRRHFALTLADSAAGPRTSTCFWPANRISL